MKYTQLAAAALAGLCLHQLSAWAAEYRVESDLLGEKQVPSDAYYGIQTVRALENFQISNMHNNDYPSFIKAWAMVKLAAARANMESGKMKREIYEAVRKACQAVMDGQYHDQFKVDMFQGGAGTSSNMNANEVLANIALEMMGKKKGEYDVLAPNDQLNMSQSTGKGILELVREKQLLTEDQIQQILDPENMTGLDKSKYAK